MIKVKRFENKESLDKDIEKLTKNIDFKKEYAIKDSEYKSITIESINVEYGYYEYWNKENNLKELSYCILNRSNIYYLIYENKGLRCETLIYQLYNYDYIKTNKLTELYDRVKYFNDIQNFKVFEIERYLLGGNSYTLNEKFLALENIQVFKEMMIKKAQTL